MFLLKSKLNQKFITAVKNNDVDLARKLLKKGADVDAVKWKGITPTALMVACENGYSEMVELLLDNNANINAQAATSVVNYTPLHYLKYDDIKKKHIKKIIRKNFLNGFGKTPLYFASQNGHLDIVERLLKENADPNLPTEKIRWDEGRIYPDSNPLDVVAYQTGQARYSKYEVKGKDEDYTKIGELLIKRGASAKKVDDIGASILFRAAFGQNVLFVKLLLDAGAEVNSSSYKPLYASLEGGNIEIIKLLIERNATIDQNTFLEKKKYKTLLSKAIEDLQKDYKMEDIITESIY